MFLMRRIIKTFSQLLKNNSYLLRNAQILLSPSTKKSTFEKRKRFLFTSQSFRWKTYLHEKEHYHWKCAHIGEKDNKRRVKSANILNRFPLAGDIYWNLHHLNDTGNAQGI